MTPRQRDLLNAIKKLTVEGVPPTFQELADELGTCKSNIHRLVEGLKAQRLINAEYGLWRSLSIVPKNNVKAMSTTSLVILRGEIDQVLQERGI